MADSIRQGGGRCWRTIRPSVRPMKSHGYRKASAAGEGCKQGLAETAPHLVIFPITASTAPRIWLHSGLTTTRGLYDVIAAAFGLFHFFVFPSSNKGMNYPFLPSLLCLTTKLIMTSQSVRTYWHIVYTYWLSVSRKLSGIVTVHSAVDRTDKWDTEAQLKAALHWTASRTRNELGRVEATLESYSGGTRFESHPETEDFLGFPRSVHGACWDNISIIPSQKLFYSS